MEKLSLFGGKGFVLGNFAKLYPEISYIEPRNSNKPKYKNIVYGISTCDNYNIYSDIYLDVCTNILKLLNVLENCKNKNITFNFLSSWFVYAGCKDLPAKESELTNPLGFYSATKKCAESMLITYCELNNIKWRIFRLCNIFGKGDKYSKKRNALQYLINEIKEEKDINLYHEGKFYRDYLDNDTCCNAIKFLIDKSPVNKIYNIGGGKPVEFLSLMEFARKEYNSKSQFLPVIPPKFHSLVQCRDMWLDTTELEFLGFDNKIDIYSKLKEVM